MKALTKSVIVFFLLLLAVLCFFLFKGYDDPGSDTIQIDHWQINWTDQFDPQISLENLKSLHAWQDVKANDVIPEKPSTGMSQWSRFQLPELTDNSQILFIDKINASHVVVMIDGERVYESKRLFNYAINNIVIPITAENSNQTVYIGSTSATYKIGLFAPIKIGDYQGLMKKFVRDNVPDLVLGSTLIFIAAIMLVCALFLKHVHIPMWFSLC